MKVMNKESKLFNDKFNDIVIFINIFKDFSLIGWKLGYRKHQSELIWFAWMNLVENVQVYWTFDYQFIINGFCLTISFESKN